jgi:hypothetical protein
MQRLKIANLLLAFCVSGAGGWYMAMMLRASVATHGFVETRSAAASVFTKAFDPLAIARIFRSDLPSALRSDGQSKTGPNDHERVSFSGLEDAIRQVINGGASPASATNADASTPADAANEDAAAEPAALQDAADSQTGRTVAASPILRLTPAGQIEIGNFKTLNLDSGSCLDLGYALLNDLGAPRSALQIVGQSQQITIGRICASNGSVVISCRAGQTTFSPRRPRPDDSCTRA